jgi:hypothetical protein
MSEYQEAPLMLTDLDFFDQELIKYREGISETVADKRI